MPVVDEWRRFLAPAAFLLAVTIAVVLVRAGLHGGGARATSSGAASSSTVSSTTTGGTTTTRGRRYWVVKAGDTFGVISSRTGVPVATIERLNPNVSSTSLFIGERVRLR